MMNGESHSDGEPLPMPPSTVMTIYFVPETIIQLRNKVCTKNWFIFIIAILTAFFKAKVFHQL